jgi:hypothetical protein
MMIMMMIMTMMMMTTIAIIMTTKTPRDHRHACLLTVKDVLCSVHWVMRRAKLMVKK